MMRELDHAQKCNFCSTSLTPISRHPKSDTHFVTTQKYVEKSTLITKSPY